LFPSRLDRIHLGREDERHMEGAKELEQRGVWELKGKIKILVDRLSTLDVERTVGSRRRWKWRNASPISQELGPSSKVNIVWSFKYQDQSGSKRMMRTRVFFMLV